jgi:hypothetical protein
MQTFPLEKNFFFEQNEIKRFIILYLAHTNQINLLIDFIVAFGVASGRIGNFDAGIFVSIKKGRPKQSRTDTDRD